MAVQDDEPLCVCCRQRPVDPVWRPFCGERCKIQDLARWADGSYAVPGETVAEPSDDEPGNNT
jgi:endogenous inhibitor of DNA gyrase (YacG/DUF329 family)